MSEEVCVCCGKPIPEGGQVCDECNKVVAEAGYTATADVRGEWVQMRPKSCSARFRCSWCGGLVYYPQSVGRDRRPRCQYEYCPHCRKRMWTLPEEE